MKYIQSKNTPLNNDWSWKNAEDAPENSAACKYIALFCP